MTSQASAFVAYYRVSTDRQGESGLGLEAQRVAVARFTRNASLLSEFQEIESGKRPTSGRSSPLHSTIAGVAKPLSSSLGSELPSTEERGWAIRAGRVLSRPPEPPGIPYRSRLLCLRSCRTAVPRAGRYGGSQQDEYAGVEDPTRRQLVCRHYTSLFTF